MRLLHVLPILSLLFGASASSLDSRMLDAHPLDARDVSDVCASWVNQQLYLTISDGDPDDDVTLDIGGFSQPNIFRCQPISRILTVCQVPVFVSRTLTSGWRRIH
jgi:hypothetical protein